MTLTNQQADTLTCTVPKTKNKNLVKLKLFKLGTNYYLFQWCNS